eukprot:250946-Hanusia_phi.AAC.1
MEEEERRMKVERKGRRLKRRNTKRRGKQGEGEAAELRTSKGKTRAGIRGRGGQEAEGTRQNK